MSEFKRMTMLEDGERYTDSDGNECDLPTMCRREPGWAANRIAALLAERQRHAEEVARLEERCQSLAIAGALELTPGYRISIPLTHVDGPEERELLRRRHPPHPDIPRNLIAQVWFESGYDTAALEFWDVVHEANRELAARDAEIERLTAARDKLAEEVAALRAQLRRVEEERDRLRQANETLAVRMDLTASQLLMVGSELCGDGKIDPNDHRDPRWTPTLQRAAEVTRELAALARAATNREETPTP